MTRMMGRLPSYDEEEDGQASYVCLGDLVVSYIF